MGREAADRLDALLAQGSSGLPPVVACLPATLRAGRYDSQGSRLDVPAVGVAKVGHGALPEQLNMPRWQRPNFAAWLLSYLPALLAYLQFFGWELPKGSPLRRLFVGAVVLLSPAIVWLTVYSIRFARIVVRRSASYSRLYGMLRRQAEELGESRRLAFRLTQLLFPHRSYLLSKVNYYNQVPFLLLVKS